MNIQNRLNEIDDRLGALPKGTLTFKNIKGKSQPYVQQNIEGKSVSYYIKVDEREQILLEFDEKSALLEEKKHLQKYMESLATILKNNPYLDRQAGIGWQSFGDMIDNQMLYVDKTGFIKEWWESSPQVSLITRPRRFGKTLLMSTVQHFFDPRYKGYEKRFEQLSIWKEDKYRRLYATIPTIMISFASVKSRTFDGAMKAIKEEIRLAYDNYALLENSEILDENIKELFAIRRKKLYMEGENVDENSIRFLLECLYKHYKVKPIILLDEYDTPIIEAYTSGYYEEMMEFYRRFFNITFKNNEFMFRAIITGVNKISKNSLYSDMNNVYVYSMLSEGYGESFGFTEEEVRDILKCQDIDLMQNVKENYDGFIIGNIKDIYNPWSICNFVYTGKFDSYWVNTSSNKLIGELIKNYPNRNKQDIEALICGEEIEKAVDEDLSIEYVVGDEATFWSLMVAVGYVKAIRIEDENSNLTAVKKYRLSATNLETLRMLEKEASYIFENDPDYNVEFAEALVNDEIEKVNDIIEEILLYSTSFFDTANTGGGKKIAENFYHGLVLGLICVLKDRYHITSNRESGRGRYDICMVPFSKDEKAIIIEFKVRDSDKENSLEDTVKSAFEQIEKRGYDAEILSRGFNKKQIEKIAFAFDGKESLVKKI